LIALEWYYSNIDQIAAKANELYFEGSAAFQAWAENCAQQMINGSSTFVVSSVAAAEINSKLGNYVIPLETGSVLVLPADLLSLRTLNPSDVLITSVAGSLEDLEGVSVENNKLLKDIKAYLSTAFNNLISWQRTLNNTITQRLTSLRSFMNVINNNLIDYINKVIQEVYNVRQSLSGRLDELNNTLSSKLDTVDTKLHTINQNFLNKIAGISQQIKNLSDSLIYRVNNIMTYIDALPQDIASALKSNFSSLQQTLERIEAKVGELTDVGTVTKPNIEVVAGTQTIVVSDYATMGQAFSAKMGWIPQIFDFLAELRSRLNSGTAPKVAIYLSDAEGSYNYGGKVYVLDMSWYARYKPSVDTFLSGVMWICFGWAIYKRIPDIISGVGLTVENATETRGHVWAERAERSASLSYRQQRREDYYNKHGRR